MTGQFAAQQERIVLMARSGLRTVGPRFSQQDDRANNHVDTSHCVRCNPEPEVYTCAACGIGTTERWKFRLHLHCGPKWCQERMEKTARNWARQA